MLNEGEVEWLTHGLVRVDKKLQRLAELNEVMAFRPWALRSSHVEFLVKGEETD